MNKPHRHSSQRVVEAIKVAKTTQQPDQTKESIRQIAKTLLRIKAAKIKACTADKAKKHAPKVKVNRSNIDLTQFHTANGEQI